MKCSLPLIYLMLTFPIASAQSFVANYDESKVPVFELPDPLKTEAGITVLDEETWKEKRRPEVVELFEKHVYGRSPEPVAIHHELISTKKDAVNGKALRREVDITIGEVPHAVTMRMLVYTPKESERVPTFLGLNFGGNQTVESDPTISITASWVRNKDSGTSDNHATEASRGASSASWPVEFIIDRGYGVATIYYGDIDPDFHDKFKNGIHSTFSEWAKGVPQTERWGSIAAWSYGLSRALDYLQTDKYVDGDNVAVIGHSRLGKTALWAGANDPRFKLVVSNNSGCGGAALSRRAYGETVGRITSSFPHWFCGRFQSYSQNEMALPVDQHELLALIAPRALYVASATEDQWADPKGEFLSAVYADPVYRLLGTDGLGGAAAPKEMPQSDKPINTGAIGYHVRTGKHAITEYDWARYIDFADRHLKRSSKID